MFEIATRAFAVSVRLVALAIDATMPTVLPEVFPIQLPTVNSETKDVPTPDTALLFVAQVIVPVNATLGKLVVKCIGLSVVAILILSVAIFDDDCADPFAV